MRRSLATFHARLGRGETSVRLFRGWLERDPAWGWGWIGWSDCHYLDTDTPDAERAEQLLQQGLSVPGIRDQVDVLDRLHTLYDELGREAEAARVAVRIREAERAMEEEGPPVEEDLEVTEMENVLRFKHTLRFGGHGLPVEQMDRLLPRGEPVVPVRSVKIGRNAPCPCGSGRKHKRCCG